MAAPVFSAAISGLLADVLAGNRYVLGRSVFNLTGSGTQIIGLGIGGAVLAAVPARWLLLAAGHVAGHRRRHRPARPAARGARVRTTPPRGPCGREGHAWRRGPRRHARDRARHRSGQRRTARQPRGAGPAARAMAARVVRHRSRVPGRPVHGITRPTRRRGGPLLAAVPAGMVLGEVLVGRFATPQARRRLAFPLAAAMGTPPARIRLPSPAAAGRALLLVTGFGFAYLLGIQQAFLASVPERCRGQAFGLNSTGAMGGQGLIPPAAGGLASAIGPAAAMAAAGAATVLAALLLRGPLTGRDRATRRGRPRRRRG